MNEASTDARAESGAETGDEAAGAQDVRAVVGAHIAPVTRFDAGSLAAVGPDELATVPLVLTAETIVSFSTATETRPGRLPAGVDPVTGAEALTATLDARLAQARAGAPKALQNWASRAQGTYRRLLPTGGAFLKDVGRAGYDFSCPGCQGACKVRCGSCGGKGHTDCIPCLGTGRVTCTNCHGTRSTRCFGCSFGKVSEQAQESVWNPSTSSYETRYHTVQRDCSQCRGTGNIPCTSCDYGGKQRCHGCAGQGRNGCGRCGHTGRIDCIDCLATGYQHRQGTVEAEVDHSEHLVITTDDADIRSLVQAHIALADLPAYGALDDTQAQVQDRHTLHTVHRLHLDVRSATLRVVGAELRLHGFGPSCKVFDFRNIAGLLLAGDLQALEEALAASSRWRRRDAAGLLDALTLFLESELHLLVAEQPAAAGASAQDAARAAEARFAGLADADYIQRASAALNASLRRVYAAELLVPTAAIGGATALACALAFGFGATDYSPWTAAAAGLGTAATLWFGWEWWTRRRISRRVDPVIGQRLVAQLRSAGAVQRHRRGAAVFLSLAVVGSVLGTASLPPVKAGALAHRTALFNAQLLDRWFADSEPDLQRRRYPPAAYLQARAEAGDQRALVVRAWQALLGLDGEPRNAEEAGRWLDRADAGTRTSAAWKAARAAQVLHQKSMPDDIRKAKAELAEAGDQGLAEARYWLARIHLSPQVPERDERLGLRLLAQAADVGHAHAALLLGSKLAKGEGMPRNTAKARPYLYRAAAAGLPEAQPLLDGLR